MKTFSELPLCAVLQENLAKNQFVTPTPVQAQAIPAALSGRDVLATAQTGTGKTAAFALPMLQRLASDQAKRAAGDEVTLNVEGGGDGDVAGEEALG